jgi:hypothetical protein
LGCKVVEENAGIIIREKRLYVTFETQDNELG